MLQSSNKAVIWDMDGVIADTIPFHFKAWQEVLHEQGIDFTQDDFKRVFGMGNDEVIRSILGGDVIKDDIGNIAQRKEENFRQRIRQNIKVLPGVMELLRLFTRQGFKQALASSAPLENLLLLINTLEIGDFFECIVSEEGVTRGKPDPEVFLTAAKRLGLEPKNCLVIEDAVAGVTAANAAKMKCIAITNTFPKESLKEADLVVNSLEEVDGGTLEKFFLSDEDVRGDSK